MFLACKQLTNLPNRIHSECFNWLFVLLREIINAILTACSPGKSGQQEEVDGSRLSCSVSQQLLHHLVFTILELMNKTG